MKVIIEPDGITAKEVNPLGERPHPVNFLTRGNWEKGWGGVGNNRDKIREWEKADRERKVYEISFINSALQVHQIQPGQIHEAELIGTDKIRIL